MAISTPSAPSSGQLEAFQTWMMDRGRSEDTAKLYAANVARCLKEKSATTRLVGAGLSPNYRRLNLASLRAWARFTNDHALTDRLADLRLPPAKRVTNKVPLEVEQWRKLIKHLRSCDKGERVMRCVCVIMAVRGLRCGDVLRIKRTEVKHALKTGTLPFLGKGGKRHEFAAETFRPELEILASIPNWERVSDLAGTMKHANQKVRRELRRHAKELAIEGTYPHQLRRTVATNFLSMLRGDPQAVVKLQQWMAWSNLNTALGYVDAVSVDELNTIGEKMVDDLLGDET